MLSLALSATTSERAVDQQHNERPADGEQPGAEVEESAKVGLQQHAAKPAADDSAYNPQDEGGKEPARSELEVASNGGSRPSRLEEGPEPRRGKRASVQG